MPEANDSTSTEGTTSGSSDLNSFLSDWDSKGNEAAKASAGNDSAKPNEGADSELAKLRAELEDLKRVNAETSYETAMGKAIDVVKGDLAVDDFVVEAWLNRKANQDEKIVEVWNARDSQASSFNKLLEAMKTDFQKEATANNWVKGSKSKDNGDATTGNEAAAARTGARNSGGQSQGTEFGDFSTMSDGEFALKKSAVFKAAREGRLSP